MLKYFLSYVITLFFYSQKGINNYDDGESCLYLCQPLGQKNGRWLLAIIWSWYQDMIIESIGGRTMGAVAAMAVPPF